MQTTASLARATDTPRLLSRAGVARLLRRCQVPSYHLVGMALDDILARGRILAAWRAVFGVTPTDPQQYTFDLECEFVARVHRELFPVDLSFLDDFYNSGEGNLLDYWIPFNGYGLPWELSDAMDEVEACATPVLAVLGSLGFLNENDFDIDVDDMLDDLATWWYRKSGQAELPAWDRPPGDEAGLKALQARLRRLPPPLDALADVVDIALKNTGNTFLDSVPWFWDVEYTGGYYGLDWTAENVRELAEEFDRARPAVNRLEAYKRWYDGQVNPREVCARLVGAIQEGACDD